MAEAKRGLWGTTWGFWTHCKSIPPQYIYILDMDGVLQDLKIKKAWAIRIVLLVLRQKYTTVLQSEWESAVTPLANQAQSCDSLWPVYYSSCWRRPFHYETLSVSEFFFSFFFSLSVRWGNKALSTPDPKWVPWTYFFFFFLLLVKSWRSSSSSL